MYLMKTIARSEGCSFCPSLFVVIEGNHRHRRRGNEKLAPVFLGFATVESALAAVSGEDFVVLFYQPGQEHHVFGIRRHAPDSAPELRRIDAPAGGRAHITAAAMVTSTLGEKSVWGIRSATT